MKLTTKSRYAINALTELSNLSSNGPVAIKDIANRQNIEVTYLEQLFRKLRIAGIVKSIRGRQGGYVYAYDPETISIKQVMDAVDENLDATNCKGSTTCFSGQECSSHKLWHELNTVVKDFLSNVFIDQLAKDKSRSSISLREIHS
tara:strand:- start:136 stop:573 length:438 start_codon:yes stop_codon:yes gene_type:complete